ncbi:PHP domain-containing protein [Pleurocapsa sp. FMAR1]|uniref:PHP domain-containing protein n=1 Tax=Pleurocapsa sp. FMAR1 TaxID=3040204 RepID=UPI0029C68D71|nr:PHP domain-containing protein [Pleurocapsa sp. FMAR1]
MIELHTHTTYSDGILTPQQLVERAAKAGVKALAITDHDTLQGWDEAIAAATPHNMEIVPGVELSTVHNERSLHILGYYPQRELLEAPLAERLAGRKRRAKEMVANLAAMGYPLEITNLEGNMALGRPHIASAMVKAGYVNSVQEAFACFLGEDQPAYVHYEKFSIQAGIGLIRDCGGVPVWAHPYLFRGGKVEEVLPELVEAGLMGIEVYHPHHAANKVNRLKELCQQYDLLMTGGTDYHGYDLEHPENERWQLNQFNLPLNLLEPIKQAAR